MSTGNLKLVESLIGVVMEDEEFGDDFFTDTNTTDLGSLYAEFFKDTQVCTHTHACNPPGPDSSHTHTCYHVHTKLVPAMGTGDDDKTTPTDDNTAQSSENKGKKLALGNREAVRKYRKKKKARAASLENEVARLKAINQQLMKRIQSQAGLEAEVARLRCLLVDIRGRIDGEIGSFPYQKQMAASDHNMANPNMGGGYVMNPCDMQCGDQAYCLHPVVDGNSGEVASIHDPCLNGCEFQNLNCFGNQNPVLNELPGCANPSSGLN